jgi:hypothetical protein
MAVTALDSPNALCQLMVTKNFKLKLKAASYFFSLNLTSCRFCIVWPRSSAVLLKNVNIEVRINSGQFFTSDLQRKLFIKINYYPRGIIRSSGAN